MNQMLLYFSASGKKNILQQKKPVPFRKPGKEQQLIDQLYQQIRLLETLRETETKIDRFPRPGQI